MGTIGPRPYTVVLCEDLVHRVFIVRFLKGLGWTRHKFRLVPFPAGEGSGEAYVRERIVPELREHYRRRSHRKGLLIVVCDADTRSVRERLTQLRSHCEADGVPLQGPGDGIMVVVPRRNIATWLAYLDGLPVDEDTDYPSCEPKGAERDCQRQVDALLGMCEEGALREPSPPSLGSACQDWTALLPYLNA